MPSSLLDAVACGAENDGETLATRPLQAALDRLAQQGGGTLVFPPGTYLTGTLRLPSHVTLHVSAGATLLASPDLADYPPQPYAHPEWGPTTCLLFAQDARDIHLEGRGVIDLNGDAFMDYATVKTGEHFTPELAAQLTPTQFAQSTCEARPRPVQCLLIHDCEAVSVRDVTVRHAPCWALTFSRCTDVAIHGLRIRNHLRVPNSDGIHLCGCRHVVITACDLVCGDDCIALTGITDWSRPCERILIADCLLQSSSAAVRLGHLASRIRDVTIRGLQIVDSNRGLAFFAGAGGCIEDVAVSQVTLKTRLTAGHWWGGGEPLVLCAADAPEAAIRRIRFADIRAQSEQGIVAIGTAGNIDDIELHDWTLQLARGPNRPLLGHVLDLRPAPVRPAPPAGSIPWLYAETIGTLQAYRISVQAANDLATAAQIVDSPQVRLRPR